MSFLEEDGHPSYSFFAFLSALGLGMIIVGALFL